MPEASTSTNEHKTQPVCLKCDETSEKLLLSSRLTFLTEGFCLRFVSVVLDILRLSQQDKQKHLWGP